MLGAFGFGDMSLELNGIGADCRQSLDISVSGSQAAVVCKANFANNKQRLSMTDGRAIYFNTITQLNLKMVACGSLIRVGAIFQGAVLERFLRSENGLRPVG